MTQTYCEIADVEDILSEAGVTAFVDDPEDGTRDVADTLHITNAIERSAGKMNTVLGMVYALPDLAGSNWCKWTNATWAAFEVVCRRNEPAPAHLQQAVNELKEDLKQIKAGNLRVPDITKASFDHLPSITNYDPERWHRSAPIRVDREESTRGAPDSSIKRRLARQHGRR